MKNEYEGVTGGLDNASVGASMRGASKIAIWLAAVGALVASVSFTSQAHAWGTCGRGPWVTASAPIGTWTPESICRCSNGQRGSIKVLSYYQWGVINAWNGPSNGGAGAEVEAKVKATGEIVYIGLTFEPSDAPSSLAMPNGQWYEGWHARAPIDGHASGPYEPTGRYRSVCITNYPSLPSSPDSYPWIWL
jgi:hypothetical protein